MAIKPLLSQPQQRQAPGQHIRFPHLRGDVLQHLLEGLVCHQVPAALNRELNEGGADRYPPPVQKKIRRSANENFLEFKTPFPHTFVFGQKKSAKNTQKILFQKIICKCIIKYFIFSGVKCKAQYFQQGYHVGVGFLRGGGAQTPFRLWEAGLALSAPYLRVR